MTTRPAIFKWRQTEPQLILCAVRWYLRYSLSLRDVEELLEERCLEAVVGSSTGAVARRLILGLFPGFPPSCPFRTCRDPVSSARHIARSVRISRTTRSCILHIKSYGT